MSLKKDRKGSKIWNGFGKWFKYIIVSKVKEIVLIKEWKMNLEMCELMHECLCFSSFSERTYSLLMGRCPSDGVLPGKFFAEGPLMGWLSVLVYLKRKMPHYQRMNRESKPYFEQCEDPAGRLGKRQKEPSDIVKYAGPLFLVFRLQHSKK